MKVSSIALATLLVSGSLGFAQAITSSGPVCLVPSRSMSATRPVATSMYTMPQSTVPVTRVMGTQQQFYGMPMQQQQYGWQTGMQGRMIPQACGVGMCPSPVAINPCQPSCPSPVAINQCPPMCPPPTATVFPPLATTCSSCGPGMTSPDTQCVLNSLASLQGSIRTAGIAMQGEKLIEAMNELMMDEMLFRQQIARNPNMAGSEAMAMMLQTRAAQLNNAISSYNRVLASMPPDLRPFMACDLNLFNTVYWTPAVETFGTYVTLFPRSAESYQQAFAANPWLPTWHSNYQATITGVTSTQQAYAASVDWWTSGVAVLGTQEMLCAPCPVAEPIGGMSTIPSLIESYREMQQQSITPPMITPPAQPVLPRPIPPSRGEVQRPLQ